MAENWGRVSWQYAVERNGAGIGLYVINRGIGTNIVGVPIDDGALSAL